MVNTELENLLHQIRQLFAAEYARGDHDAIARIMEAAKSNASADDIKKVASRRVRVTLANRRAPAGVADGLIRRVLTEHRIKGASATFIHDSANTPNERSVSLSGVRFALDRGRRKGIYRNKEGKWFLADNASS